MKTDTQGNTVWDHTYGTADSEFCYQSRQTADGGYILVGERGSFFDGTLDFMAVKVFSNGVHDWTRTYGGSADDRCWGVIQASDGGFAMTGWTRSYGAGGSDFWLVKTNALGNSEWSRTFGGSQSDLSYNILQTSDHGYILIGRTNSFGAGNYDGWIVRTNSAGDSLWSRTFGGAANDVFYRITACSDGGYLVTGETASWGEGGIDCWVVKVNASGVQQWSRTYGGSGYDCGEAVWEVPDGGFIIAARTSSFGTGSNDFWLFKCNEDGGIVWSKLYGQTCDETVNAALPTLDGGYLIAGSSSCSESSDFFLVKTGTDTCLIPEPPHIIAMIHDEDVHLHWNAVTQTLGGYPIVATQYHVFSSQYAEGPWTFLDNTSDTLYVHSQTVSNDASAFYRVKASYSPSSTQRLVPQAAIFQKSR